MNVRLSTLMSLLLLVGVQTGSCFYNPQPGRWLNRDPLHETADRNLFSFTRNTSITSIDKLGLFSLFTTIHFETPTATMPPGHQNNPGVTSYQLIALEVGAWEACGPGCKKRVGTQMALIIETWFRAGSDLNMQNSAGHTLLQHENGHSDIAIATLAEPVDADLASFLNVCLKNSCADAKLAWFNARIAYHQANTRLAQWDYDGVEFGMSGSFFDTARLSLLAAVVEQTGLSLQADFLVTSQCSESSQ